MLQINQQAPNFQGVDQDGNQIQLSDFKGKKIILFFYPKANTPGCTAEACNLNENLEVLDKKGYQIIGISKDKVSLQKKFHDKFGFNYPLIADESTEICQAYEVYGEKKFMGKTYMGINRTTFIINEEQIITHIIEKVDTKNHTAQILQLEQLS